MSKIKSLILGSAATLVAVAGAQAADLPVKAKAVQYVKICSLYGAGFYYIPGTDTCIKLGGYIQADVNIASNNYNNPLSGGSFAGVFTGGGTYAGVNGNHNHDSDSFTTRSRAQLNLDTRTATEYGVVRTYWSSNFEHSTGFGPSSGNLTVDFAFVQFAGFTFGKAISNFTTPWSAYTANVNTSAYIGGQDNATGITQAAYTFQFGNGVSAQLGVEDNKTIQRAPILNAAFTPFGVVTGSTGAPSSSSLIASGAYGTGGQLSPDIVGNIRIDQAAFTAQLSGALHNVNANYYTADERDGRPSDKWGFAVSGGLLLKNLPTGPGDKFSVDLTYTEGAPKYVIGGTVGNGYNIYGSSDVGYESFAAGSLFDGVYGTGTNIELTKVWGVRASFLHNWTPNWETGVFGGYTHVDYNGNATALMNTPAILAALGAGSSYNPDFNIWQIGTRTAWTPVKNLTFSGEVLYTKIDQTSVGTITLPAGGFNPTAAYEFKDQGVFTGNLRVRRTF
ncbi:porin [Bradyrhizobium sp. SYSU BS000235]|uniref:porin n=1 Tax=Bradyrhizobium sp. SYSU BS000235 TaxID=3411332 RepID=UPI003C72D6F1